MAETSSIFPIFLRAEYREGQGFQRFQSDAQRAVAAVKREMAGIGPALDQALSRQRSSTGSLDLGIDNLRELVRQQQNGVAAARELANATRGLAEASRFQDQSLTLAAKAALEDLRSKERQLATTSEQVRLLGSVQTELNKTSSATSVLTGENLKLAQAEAAAVNGAALLEGALRGTALETGRVAKSARESAQAFELLFTAQEAKSAKAGQDFFNTALGLNAVTKSARESAQAFELMFAAQDEAAAVRGADLVQAALRGTALEAGRVTKSAQESAQAFDLLFQAQDARTTAAAQNFINTALGIDQTTKSARESARAFEEMFAAQDRAAAAAQKNAASAAQLRAELDPMFVAQQRFDQELVRADALLEAGAISTREYAAAQQLARDNLQQTARAIFQTTEATKQGTTARSNVINSVRAERTAFVQLGQQMQDVTVQAQLGTSAFIIFAQQMPQAAFALSGLEGSANKTKATIGRFATFLSGPWGAAIFAAAAVLGPFVASLFDAGDAANEAERKSYNFASGLDVLSLSADDAKAAMDQLANSLRSAIVLQGSFIRGEAAIAKQKADQLQAQIRADTDERAALRARTGGAAATFLPSLFGPSAEDLKRERELTARIDANRSALPSALEASAAGALAVAQRNVEESFDPLLGKIRQVDEEIAKLNARLVNTKNGDDPLSPDNISDADFAQQFGALLQQRKALEEQQRESRRSASGGGVSRALREAQQLERFGDSAEESIRKLNEKFDEQPRLIDQAAQATRELDSIIAELGKRKPTNFEQLIADAEAAKRTVSDALLRPFEDLREQSQQRLQIEQLLAQGRDDEVAVSQAILQLESQLGSEAQLRQKVQDLIAQGREEEAAVLGQIVDQYGALKSEAKATILIEREKSREYAKQRELLEAQKGVLATVRSDLIDILSGRKADILGNFRQALLDLQGQRLFEDIFGDAFDQLEQELSRTTPIGRANTRYVEAVDRIKATTEELRGSLAELSSAVSGTTAALNGSLNLASGDQGLAAVGADGMLTVSGARPANHNQVDIERRSIEDMANRIAKGIVDPLLAGFEEILGTKFTQDLSGVLSGVLAGYIRGGTPGAVLGGAKGLVDSLIGDEVNDTNLALLGLSETLKGALGGAQTGTSVAGIGNALGIGLSGTGAQIGGAIGSLIPIPGGQIIGAIAGGIIGKLFGANVGTANIGGSGGSLGVTGFSGKSGSRKDAAGTLAGSVLDAVDNIASELGAQIDASRGRVSIGLNKDNYRVDTTGRGKTKNEAGVLDFGKDAEAAIRAAVRDLIQDGVIQGLSEAENRLLQAGDDLEEAIRDVLDFRAVFDRLKQIKDPLGFAIDQLNKEFEGLIDLFERAGASTEEFAQLEELYNLERARAIEEATDRVVGSLKQLLNDLTIGDSGLSLRTRRANAETEFNALAARVAAGDTTAFDDFSDISKQLLDIERQLFGSTQSYFDRLAQITALTEQAIAGQSNITSIAQNQPSPFGDRQEINRSIDIMNADVTGWLRAINDNLIALAGNSGGGSGEIFPRAVQNF